MKRVLNWIVCCIGWVAVGSQAEPAHRTTTSKGVDLEAAAKATAALYALPPAAAMQADRSVTASAKPVRNSPLLPPPATPPQAAAPQLPVQQAVGEVWSGAYHCEHAEKVSLRPGHLAELVELQWKNQRWQMKRIDSRSGAMRLEDASARMVWIQLPNKSMLLDQRQGRRLLDECQHDIQVQTAAHMKTNPPPALFDTTGMGR